MGQMMCGMWVLTKNTGSIFGDRLLSAIATNSHGLILFWKVQSSLSPSVELTLTKPDLARNSVKSKLLKTKILAQSGFQDVIPNSFTGQVR